MFWSAAPMDVARALSLGYWERLREGESGSEGEREGGRE